LRDPNQRVNGYPLVNVYKKLWKITMFNGKIHYKWQFSIAMLNYQRVNIKTISNRYPKIKKMWKKLKFRERKVIYK